MKSKTPCHNCLPGRLGKCTNSPAVQNPPLYSISRPTPQESRPTSQTIHQDSSPINAHLPPQEQPDLHTIPELPDSIPIASPTFSWGSLDAALFCSKITEALEETMYWRPNLFSIPSGASGTQFVAEQARLFRAYAEGTALESVALKATTALSILALQKPHKNSKAKDHSTCLKRRMVAWKEGHLQDLLVEGRTIQNRLPKRGASPLLGNQNSSTTHAREFAKLMFEGKCGAAIKLLSGDNSSRVLDGDDIIPSGDQELRVRDILANKHPPGQPATEDALINPDETPQPTHFVLFDCIDADMIRTAAMHTDGAAGPSGINAHAWRRMCCAFKSASSDLCNALALLAKRLCTTYVDPTGLAPLLACRLIALDKCPGVRPIGVCEVARRIISKAILSVLKMDIQEATGSSQLCGGQIAGTEAAVHALRSLFAKEKTEALLLVDASNAFNSLNRRCALLNIQHICPAFSTVVINTYREHSQLLLGADSLLSHEGTTQGDPLAMPLYALATKPLIDALKRDNPTVKHVWYADDASAGGSISSLKQWWDAISSLGPSFGYHVNPSKTWLLTKSNHLQFAQEIFGESEVNITSDGRPVLGAAIGTDSFIEEFVSKKVQGWVEEIEKLASFADSQPHAAYSSLTHGLSSKWSYVCRTTPNISHLLQPLETAIRTKLLPKLIGREPPNDQKRDLLALPARLGRLGLHNPVKAADDEYRASKEITKPLSNLIELQCPSYPPETREAQMSAKKATKEQRRACLKDEAANLRESLPPSLQLAMDLAREKGASTWLTVLPIEEHGFALHKQAFRDAIALRYGWTPANLPTNCACGQPFSVHHALSCPKGGYPSIRHNEIRDLTANLLTEICPGVAVEPTLQPLSSEQLTRATANTQDGARLDVVANGFWGGTYERAFLDVRVFNPFAPSNRHPQLATAYRHHETLKKRHYERRVREIEHASFTPLIFSLTGGLGPTATVFYKRLASRLSTKWDHPYASTMGWLRCRLSFSLLRASIMCIRGPRSSIHCFGGRPALPVDLVLQESKLSH